MVLQINDYFQTMKVRTETMYTIVEMAYYV